jgi:two-component sensor histidine kinase/CHASE3 domain sensor protein
MAPSGPALRKLSNRWANAALVALSALAMFLVILLVIRTIEAERGQREQAQTTGAVVDELRDISRASLNAETGQRGYLLTLDRRYLAPYFTGRDQLEPSLRRLRALLEPRADRRQLDLLQRVELLSRAKFAELERTVELVERGDLIEARRLVLTDEGRAAMDRLRLALRDLERIELAILAHAVSNAERAEERVMPLLGGLLALLAISMIAAVRLIARSARAEAAAAQAEALAEARDRADLLARELNHRVKNLFAVVLAIVKLSARDAPEAKPVAEAIAQRIRALLRAHEASQGELGQSEVSLTALIETTLAPYRSPVLTATLSGPTVMVPARAVTPLGLVLHELTTNAVKYGAWAQPGGTIAIDWTKEGETVALTWREEGHAIEAQPARTGFGTMLMTSAARQLGHEIEREFLPTGARITIRFAEVS